MVPVLVKYILLVLQIITNVVLRFFCNWVIIYPFSTCGNRNGGPGTTCLFFQTLNVLADLDRDPTTIKVLSRCQIRANKCILFLEILN
jgi:hypothetical protein